MVPFLKRNLCTNGLKWKWMFILECKLGKGIEMGGITLKRDLSEKGFFDLE